MRVGIPDAQASNRIYYSTTDRRIEAHRNPLPGELLCMSRGYSSDPYDCGSVEDTIVDWTGNACQCRINGARGGTLAAIPGDSGSPIFSNGSPGVAIAVGIHNASSGTDYYFAKMQNLMGQLGGTVVTE